MVMHSKSMKWRAHATSCEEGRLKMRDAVPVAEGTNVNLRQPMDRLVRSSTHHCRAEETER